MSWKSVFYAPGPPSLDSASVECSIREGEAGVPAMVVGVLVADLLLGDVHSLKEKRSVVRPIVAELRRRFDVSAAETGAAGAAPAGRGVGRDGGRRPRARGRGAGRVRAVGGRPARGRAAGDADPGARRRRPGVGRTTTMADAGRARRLAGRIKQIVATVLEMQVKDPRLGMVTITDVRVTGDLHEATVFYTVLGTDEERVASAAALESAKGVVRSEVGRQTGVRFTPTITFAPDIVPETAKHIDELLAVAAAPTRRSRPRAAAPSRRVRPTRTASRGRRRRRDRPRAERRGRWATGERRRACGSCARPRRLGPHLAVVARGRGRGRHVHLRGRRSTYEQSPRVVAGRTARRDVVRRRRATEPCSAPITSAPTSPAPARTSSTARTWSRSRRAAAGSAARSSSTRCAGPPSSVTAACSSTPSRRPTPARSRCTAGWGSPRSGWCPAGSGTRGRGLRRPAHDVPAAVPPADRRADPAPGLVLIVGPAASWPSGPRTGERRAALVGNDTGRAHAATTRPPARLDDPATCAATSRPPGRRWWPSAPTTTATCPTRSPRAAADRRRVPARVPGGADRRRRGARGARARRAELRPAQVGVGAIEHGGRRRDPAGLRRRARERHVGGRRPHRHPRRHDAAPGRARFLISRTGRGRNAGLPPASPGLRRAAEAGAQRDRRPADVPPRALCRRPAGGLSTARPPACATSSRRRRPTTRGGHARRATTTCPAR